MKVKAGAVLLLVAIPLRSIAGQDPYDLLMTEAQTQTTTHFDESVWKAQNRSRAVVTKPALAGLIGSVSTASTLEITVTLPSQDITVPVAEVRSPKLTLGDCQANQQNCPDCEWWNAPCHAVRLVCEVAKGTAQGLCISANLIASLLSEKKLASVEFPDAHVDGELTLSAIRVAVSDKLDVVTVSGQVAGAAYARSRVSLQPEIVPTLSGCWKTDMDLTRTKVEPADSNLSVAAAVKSMKTDDGLKFSYRIPEIKPKIRVEEVVYLKLLRDNMGRLFSCPHIILPGVFDIIANPKTLLTQEHEVKIDASTGETDVLKFTFDVPGAKRQITVVEGETWLGIDVLEPQVQLPSR
jgi:hypothetical protein